MIGTILIGVAVFAAQVIAYRVVSKKLAQRRRFKERLASIASTPAPSRPWPQPVRNRLGED